MIVEQLAEFAVRRGLVDDPAFEPRAVTCMLRLRADGSVFGVDGLEARPRMLIVPAQPRRSRGIAPYFLCDTIEYALGQHGRGRLSAARIADMHVAFVALIAEASAELVGERALAALARFHARPRPILDVPDGSRVAFALEDDALPMHLRPEIAGWWRRRYRSCSSGAARRCIFTAAPVAEPSPHPSIFRLPGGHRAGTALVSNNLPAAESYGWPRHANAPIDAALATACARGLNHLLAAPGAHRIELSPCTAVVYWATEPHELVEGLAEVWATGRAPRGTAGPQARFFSLALSAVGARATTRWFDDRAISSLDAALRRFAADTALAHEGAPVPIAPRSMACGPRERGGASAYPATLALDLFAALVTGAPPTRRLLQAAMAWCGYEGRVTWARAALIKLWLLRHQERASATLDPADDRLGHLLGRALALIERIERRRRRGLPSRHRYRATSSRPAITLPPLLRAARGATDRQSSADLAAVMDRVSSIPPLLSLTEQAAFALGYFHEGRRA